MATPSPRHGRPGRSIAVLALLALLTFGLIWFVAPDRLGVLHDVTATVRAASTVGLAVHHIVLSAPAVPDASTGTNAGELRVGLPVTSLPRASIADLRRDPALVALAGLCI